MMTKRTFLLFLSLIFILTGLLAAPKAAVYAQDPKPTPSDNDVNRVAKQMYCPVCENIPLDVCPTQACSEWRELIRLKLSQGWTDQQIKDYFAQQYGDRVLASPPQRGLNLLVYIMPLVALLVGAVIVWRVLVSMRSKITPGAAPSGDAPRAPGAAQPAPGTPDDPYLARLEEELRKKD